MNSAWKSIERHFVAICTQSKKMFLNRGHGEKFLVERKTQKKKKKNDNFPHQLLVA